MLTLTATSPSLPFNTDLLIIGSQWDIPTLIQPMLHPSASIRNTNMVTEALKLFTQKRPDLILIDSDLPFHCSHSLVMHFRRFSTASIIQIGKGNHREERIQALTAGVDHYITTPIDLEELTAIIKNAYRHAKIVQTIHNQLPDHWSCCRLDRALYTPNGHHIELTPNELRLIEVIAAHNQSVITHHAFAAAFKRTNTEGFDKLLHVSIGRLRKKILDGCGEAFPLTSVRASGFRFEKELALLPVETRP